MEPEQGSFFDETGYESDEEPQDTRTMHRKAKQSQNQPSKALTPAESNMTLSMREGEELMEMMKNRGFDMNDAEIKRMKPKAEISKATSKPKAGFFDGGHAATMEELISALNKAYTQNDTQQASCILSFILEKPDLSKEDRNKFGLMKCNLLFSHGSYEECSKRASELLVSPFSQLSSTILSVYLARCKAELDRVWEGYMDLERAKSLLFDLKVEREKRMVNQQLKTEFSDSDLDAVLRDFNTVELEYNIRTNKEKQIVNVLEPLFPQFRNRKILQVACGDHHAIILANGHHSLDPRKTQEKDDRDAWRTEVFGVGENSAGQVLGTIYEKSPCSTQPVLIKELSGKGIIGVYAFRESSLAYDSSGNVYEWGVKSNGLRGIESTVCLGFEIKKLEKGSKHYAALTSSGKFFVWGEIEHKGKVIFSQDKPFEVKNVGTVVEFSCGVSHLVLVNKEKQVFGVGSGELGQLGGSEDSKKEFSKMDTSRIGLVHRVFCLLDCTFLLTEDEELFFCGRYSYKKEPILALKQCEFTDDIEHMISVSGHTGIYYVTNQDGVVYKWDVDNSVKFRRSADKESTPRIISCSRGVEYQLKTLPKPELCTSRILTSNIKTYTPIHVEIVLGDEFGIYGLELAQPLKVHLCLSKDSVKADELMDSSQKFIKLTGNKYTKNEVYLDEIIESNLLSYSNITSNARSKIILEVMVEKAGRYNLYILINSTPVKGSPLSVAVQQSEKEVELEKKMLEERERKRQQRELERQRMEEAKRAEEEERLAQIQRRKETDKRAEDALKKHMKEQSDEKLRLEQEKRRRAELQTGGGFDLSKLKTKSSIPAVEEYKGSIPDLPDINQRPSSKRKLVLKKPSLQAGSLTGVATLPNGSTASTQLGATKVVTLKRGDSKQKRPS